MAGMHYMDIRVLPCKNPSNVVRDVKSAVVKATEKVNGKIIWLFKIVGENRILAFVENCADAILDALNEAAGEFLNVACNVIRCYEDFAKMNEVDEKLCTPSPRKLTPGGRIFFIDVFVKYKGHPLEEMRKVWRAESTLMLGNRKEGKLEIDIFKVIADNRVLTLMKIDPNALDDMAFTVPLVTELGDNCLFVTSEVTNMLQ